MERITDVCWRNLDPWECCGQDNYCERGCYEEGGCSRGCIVPKIYDRLAAYEDTGLEPEEAARLVQAKRGGRLVVLPCKVGDTVYRIYDDCDFPGDCHTKRMCKGCEYRNLFIEEQAFCLSMLSQNGTLGHPYYLTREEAEAALEKEKKKEEQKCD